MKVFIASLPGALSMRLFIYAPEWRRLVPSFSYSLLPATTFCAAFQVEELRRQMARTALRASDSPFWDLLPPSAKAACLSEYGFGFHVAASLVRCTFRRFDSFRKSRRRWQSEGISLRTWTRTPTIKNTSVPDSRSSLQAWV